MTPWFGSRFEPTALPLTGKSEPWKLALAAALRQRTTATKLEAYHRHIQIGLVAQGILQCLAALQPKLVWRYFASWLRTKKSPECPSELVVATALRHSLPDFLAAGPRDPNWRKFLRDRLDVDQFEGERLAA